MHLLWCKFRIRINRDVKVVSYSILDFIHLFDRKSRIRKFDNIRNRHTIHQTETYHIHLLLCKLLVCVNRDINTLFKTKHNRIHLLWCKFRICIRCNINTLLETVNDTWHLFCWKCRICIFCNINTGNQTASDIMHLCNTEFWIAKCGYIISLTHYHMDDRHLIWSILWICIFRHIKSWFQTS